MPSLIPSFEYDVYISYRQKDNLPATGSGGQEDTGWVTEFVSNLKRELQATFKEEVSVYFDVSPVDGLLETHQIDDSLEGKLKCLVFIPIISQTYCDTKSFAWNKEFLAFKQIATKDEYGLKVKLPGGNVALRVLPVRIHDLNVIDKALLENELGPLRAVDFIFSVRGVNRPLTAADNPDKNLNKTYYRDQINKVANAVQQVIIGIQTKDSGGPISSQHEIGGTDSQRKPGNRSQKRILAVSLVLFIAVSLFLFRSKLIPESVIDKKSVAVLAFEDLSPNKDQGWFSDGISEEIINSLTNLKELKVMARTSSFYFKGKDVPLAEIAEKLGVEHLVEGSVKRIDDQLRITVQLISAKDGFHLFSQTYDRPATDLLKVQSDIAESIAGKLLSQLKPEQYLRIRADKPSSVEAYEYYLRGVEIHKKIVFGPGDNRGDDLFDEAEKLFLKAISIDSFYVAAYAALANIYDTRGNSLPKRVKYWKLRDSTSLVVYRIDPMSIHALHSRFLSFFKSEQPNLDSAFYCLKRAYEIEPDNVNALGRMFYIQIGLFDQGKKFSDKALELDPLDIVSRRIIAVSSMMTGQLDKAENELKKINEMNSSPIDHANLFLLYVIQRNLNEARRELTMIEKMDTTIFRIQKAVLLAAEGQKDEALRLISPGGLPRFVWSQLGMKKELLKHLDEYTARPIPILAQVSPNIPYSLRGLDKCPLWDVIRNEPEFKRIRERVKKDHDEKLKKYGSLE